jgi:hypothetical protein
MICRDRVVATKPHEYSWRFQTYAKRAVDDSVGEGAYRITEEDASLVLKGSCPDTPLASRVSPTDVVWAYRNDNAGQGFKHIEFKTARRAASILAQFEIEWGPALLPPRPFRRRPEFEVK